MTSTIQKLYTGQSLLRILMNRSFENHTLTGKVVDVGGGRNPDYFHYFKHHDVVSIEPVDQSLASIDFERDALPYMSGSVDTVVCANVLEHIYNHAFLTKEMYRILKPGGSLIGFVPFLINYHPDPHDYFRYTHEGLRRLFSDIGFTDITISSIGGGPFAVNFNNIVLSVPRMLRPFLYVWYAALDALFLWFRPSGNRYPLGFTFEAKIPL